MTITLLIGAIVRQTTVLIAELATTGGVRAPLAQVADKVFMDLVRELERQGVSRKVSADMFGMGLRSYLRRIQRLGESSTERGRSLWEAVLDYLQQDGVVTRGQVLFRFNRDDEVQVRGVLHDLSESGLVFCSGSGADSVYRAATEEELGALRRVRRGEGLDELVWAIVYRNGPISEGGLLALGGIAADELRAALKRLCDNERIEALEPQTGCLLRQIDDPEHRSGSRRHPGAAASVPSPRGGGACSGSAAVGNLIGAPAQPEGPRYRATSFVMERGAATGFEASVFDHFQAVVKTVSCRLRGESVPLPLPEGLSEGDVLGGSTYTFDLWPGHPDANAVLATLSEFRERMAQLRERVESYNAEQGVPSSFVKLVSYAGQCLIREEQTEHVEETRS